MKSSFALPLLGGIVIGVITTGVVVLARNDFFSYKSAGNMVGNFSQNTSSSIDAMFIENMIPHHEGAIDMATLALTEAKTNEVKNLSKSIITSQQEEIDTMTTWYKEWFGTSVATTSLWSEGMMGGGNIMGSSELQGDLDSLKNAANFDKEFIKQMIPHHQMAIIMAQMLLRTTTRNEMKELAQNIINAQSAEIKEMQSWLENWE